MELPFYVTMSLDKYALTHIRINKLYVFFSKFCKVNKKMIKENKIRQPRQNFPSFVNAREASVTFDLKAM